MAQRLRAIGRPTCPTYPFEVGQRKAPDLLAASNLSNLSNLKMKLKETTELPRRPQRMCTRARARETGWTGWTGWTDVLKDQKSAAASLSPRESPPFSSSGGQS